ncbi:putative CBF1-interacting co-repressor CIR domain, pre-mRNA splicing factor [Dioscorea sansibarensis]
MALKFLNKKGWHTGSLRNIENVWKAEQKHDAEQRKLEELRKQIQEERERSEFRLLQEQAGLVPRQERLDFLYESGLAVGKGSSDSGFKALEGPSAPAATAPESSSAKAVAPGALFEDKPQSANDAWRKLHSDPLLLIRQREQEALARIKNNPIQMAMIRKSVETEKKRKSEKKEKRDKKSHKKHHRGESKGKKHSSKVHSASEESSEDEGGRERRDRSSDHHRRSKSDGEKLSKRVYSDSEDTSNIEEARKKRDHPKSNQLQHHSLKHDKHSSRMSSDSRGRCEEEDRRKNNDHLRYEKQLSKTRSDSKHTTDHEEDIRKRYQSSRSGREEEDRRKDYDHSSKTHPYSNFTIDQKEDRGKRHQSTYEHQNSKDDLGNEPRKTNFQDQRRGYGYNRHRGAPKLSEEERAARLRDMQLDAEIHEEQRFKRLKKAADIDAQEALQSGSSRGKNFLDTAQRSIFGTEKGGCSTIEESVRRRAFYSQGSSAASESNAFRR